MRALSTRLDARLQTALMKRRGLSAIHCSKASRSAWRMKSAGGESSSVPE
ncbi:MAG: hypothetical protein ACLTS9_10250 [Sutterella wadsworthensis]